MSTLNQELTYKQTVFPKIAYLSAGENFSSMVDCGGMYPAALIVPEGFTAMSTSFYVSLVPNFDLARPITYLDGTNFFVSALGGPKGQHIPLPPPYFIGASYVWIFVTIPPVANVQLELALQPYFQGIHG